MTDSTRPLGNVSIQTIAMPKDANWNGDIFGGWLVSQMDLAGAVCARQRARGRVATVAIDSMNFLLPVPVGAVISCHTLLESCGRTSMKIHVEVWICSEQMQAAKVTEGRFVFVAIDQDGNKRPLPPLASDSQEG